MGVVRHVIPGAVQAAECLLNHVLGRLPVPEHEKREPGQPQRMPLVDRGDRLAGAHLAVRRVTVPAVPAWCHGFGDQVRATGARAATQARLDVHRSQTPARAKGCLGNPPGSNE
jgi:hypothetical protein